MERSLALLEADGFRVPEMLRRLSFVTPTDLDNRPVPQCVADLLIYVAGPRRDLPHLKRISQSEMAAHLWSEIGQGPLTDSETIRVLTRMSSSARCFTLIPSSLSETADVVADLVTQFAPSINSIS